MSGATHRQEGRHCGEGERGGVAGSKLSIRVVSWRRRGGKEGVQHSHSTSLSHVSLVRLSPPNKHTNTQTVGMGAPPQAGGLVGGGPGGYEELTPLVMQLSEPDKVSRCEKTS